jgi:hypothetical protein
VAHQAEPAAWPNQQPESQVVEFAEALGLKAVMLAADKIAPLVEGATIAVVGAGDAFGEQLCLELINLKVGNLILVDDCEDKLARIGNSLSSLERNDFSYSSYLCPLGSPSLIQNDLGSHQVNWMIYGRPNRLMASNTANKSTVFACYFYDIAQYLELAQLCGCDGFSMVSPVAKGSLSQEEREFQLLTEKYVRHTASIAKSPFRCGVVRLSNILEAEYGVFLTACNRVSHRDSLDDGNQILHFTTAKNAARIFLNSLQMHDQTGRIFIGNATIQWELKKLVELFSEFRGNGHDLKSFARRPYEKNRKSDPSEFLSMGDESAANTPDLLILTDHGEEDAALFCA